ncbi:MAG: hypothetical protein ACI9XK_005114, partial [Granulosicoccus sp.]
NVNVADNVDLWKSSTGDIFCEPNSGGSWKNMA